MCGCKVSKWIKFMFECVVIISWIFCCNCFVCDFFKKSNGLIGNIKVKKEILNVNFFYFNN